MDVDMSEMRYVNADGSEMNREELIAIIEKVAEENRKKSQKICDLLNDKRKAYVEACKTEWDVRKKAELFASLPDELRYSEGNEFFNDVLDAPYAIEVMQYICNCISQNVPPYQEYDNMVWTYKNRITKDECKMYHHFAEGTFEDACDMFVSTNIDAMIDKRVIIYEKDNLHSRLFIIGLRRMWDDIKKNTDGQAGLRALFE